MKIVSSVCCVVIAAAALLSPRAVMARGTIDVHGKNAASNGYGLPVDAVQFK